MTREEQIFSAADAAYDLTPYESEQETIAFQDGFTEGVKWADKNPPQTWHKYPNEKPTHRDEWYLIAKSSGGGDEWVDTEFYPSFQNKFYNDRHIVAWAELPQPPKFD